jgi:hypothetical protein|tara:strand:- start:12974 stop:13738 length:765 start_codon:yes stop_codon:yes gene_type:complete
MARRITTGIVGKNVLGSLSTTSNSIVSVVTDEDVIIDPAGTGEIVAEGNVTIKDQKLLKLHDADSTNYIGFQAPSIVGSDYTLTFPATSGTNNYALTTNGSGILSWTDVAVQVGDDISAASSSYNVTLTNLTSGSMTAIKVVSSKLTFVPNTGTLTTTALVETSSIALKENVLPIENALDSILKLKGVVYDRKDGSHKNEAGLIAEEVNKILPNLVTKDESGAPFGINYTKFSAYLIEAVKSLSAEIDKLKQDK